MSIFSELLEEVKESDIDTRLKIICDKIFDEEKETFENSYRTKYIFNYSM